MTNAERRNLTLDNIITKDLKRGLDSNILAVITGVFTTLAIFVIPSVVTGNLARKKGKGMSQK